MKQMILTGLATEQTFTAKGEAQFYLVFNNGELKVPTTEEAAQVVVQAMYGAQQKAEPEQYEAAEDQPADEEEAQEDEPVEDDEGHSGMNGSGESMVDEDGIAQI